MLTSKRHAMEPVLQGDIWHTAGPFCRGEKSHAERLERLRGEQFFRFEPALGEPLLMVIAQERFQHMAVGLESVGPPVFAQLSASLLDVRDLPREHGGQ